MWVARAGGRGSSGRAVVVAPATSQASLALLRAFSARTSGTSGGWTKKRLPVGQPWHRWRVVTPGASSSSASRACGDHPLHSRSSTQAPPLPKGWEEMTDDKNQRYYYNKSTGKSSKERPEAEAEADSKTKGTSKDKDKDKPTSWFRVWLYFSGGISGITVLYHFRKADYSLHKTELLLLESFRRLPFYWPAGQPEKIRNTHIDPEGLTPELMEAFTQWFVGSDLQVPEGVTRDDVLELVRELGFEESERPCKDFLYRGEGELEERKRLSGCGLQETVTLLADLYRLPAPPPPKDAKEGEDLEPLQRLTGAERLDAEAVSLLSRKARTAAAGAVRAGALQQALFAQGPAAASGGAAPSAQPRAFPQIQAASPEESMEMDQGVDADQQRQIDIARMEREEKKLMALLENRGSLSPAEEARLMDIRNRKSRL